VDLGLQGRVAWVTGASSGIGRAAAAALAREGASVALSARRPGPLTDAARAIGSESGAHCIAVPLDVTDAHAIAPALAAVEAELGGVDVLVANAGGPPPGSFRDLDDTSLRVAFDVTLRSAWDLARAVTPSMVERGRGRLLFVTSWSTKEVIDGLLLSNSLRAAVVGLAKTLSKELGPDGIRVACVAPGKIDTARSRALDQATAARSGRALDDVRRDNESGIPLRRYGTPEEVGDVVAFLASERASYVTGVSVIVDGGLLNGLLS
jgi:3-oxoacyl-[acyl-carrier protein] reductase